MAFDQRWEKEIYANHLQINRYPYNDIVSAVFRCFAGVEDRSNIHILELGCGTANNIWFFAQEGFTATGIDGSESAIRLGQDILKQKGLEARLICQDFTDLSQFADQSFDMVVDRGSITHNGRAGVEKTISEVYRILKKGGIFLSHIFSTEHQGMQYGKPLGDGSYHKFEGGFFDQIPLLFFFASEDDIVELYHSKFNMLSQIHNVHYEMLPAANKRAMWQLICEK